MKADMVKSVFYLRWKPSDSEKNGRKRMTVGSGTGTTARAGQWASEPWQLGIRPSCRAGAEGSQPCRCQGKAVIVLSLSAPSYISVIDSDREPDMPFRYGWGVALKKHEGWEYEAKHLAYMLRWQTTRRMDLQQVQSMYAWRSSSASDASRSVFAPAEECVSISMTLCFIDVDTLSSVHRSLIEWKRPAVYSRTKYASCFSTGRL